MPPHSCRPRTGCPTRYVRGVRATLRRRGAATTLPSAAARLPAGAAGATANAAGQGRGSSARSTRTERVSRVRRGARTNSGRARDADGIGQTPTTWRRTPTAERGRGGGGRPQRLARPRPQPIHQPVSRQSEDGHPRPGTDPPTDHRRCTNPHRTATGAAGMRPPPAPGRTPAPRGRRSARTPRGRRSACAARPRAQGAALRGDPARHRSLAGRGPGPAGSPAGQQAP